MIQKVIQKQHIRTVCAICPYVLIVCVFFYFISYCSRKSKPLLSDIIIITIDALRSDHLGCYGYPLSTSPTADRISRRTTLLINCISAGGWTAPSVSSILTGMYPNVHGIRSWNVERNSSVTSLMQIVEKLGYHTCLITDYTPLRLIDIISDFKQKIIFEWKTATQNELLDTCSYLLRKHKQQPLMLYIHLKGTHAPYKPPEPYRRFYIGNSYYSSVKLPFAQQSENSWWGGGQIPFSVIEDNIADSAYYHSQYDSAVRFSDVFTQQFLDIYRRSGRLIKAVFIFTADHGEMMGEHDIYFCHITCHEEVTRVPVLLKSNIDQMNRGSLITGLRSNVDLVPSILDLLKIKVPFSLPGRSLFNRIAKATKQPSRSVYTHHNVCDTVRTDRWKIMRVGESQSFHLFDLESDPQERFDIKVKRNSKFNELKAELDRFKADSLGFLSDDKNVLVPQDLEMLKSLGYVE